MSVTLGCSALLHPFIHSITNDASGGGSVAPARLRNATGAAAHFLVSSTTIENWLNRGYIRGYRVDGSRQVHYNLDEIERALKVHGPNKMRDGRRRGAGRVVRAVTVVAEDKA